MICLDAVHLILQCRLQCHIICFHLPDIIILSGKWSCHSSTIYAASKSRTGCQCSWYYENNNQYCHCYDHADRMVFTEFFQHLCKPSHQVLRLIRQLFTDLSCSVCSFLCLLLCCRLSKFPLHQLFACFLHGSWHGAFSSLSGFFRSFRTLHGIQMFTTVMDFGRIFPCLSMFPYFSNACFHCCQSGIQAVCSTVVILIFNRGFSYCGCNCLIFIYPPSPLLLHAAKFFCFADRQWIILFSVPDLITVTPGCRWIIFQLFAVAFPCMDIRIHFFLPGGLLSRIPCIFFFIHALSFPKKQPLRWLFLLCISHFGQSGCHDTVKLRICRESVHEWKDHISIE